MTLNRATGKERDRAAVRFRRGAITGVIVAAVLQIVFLLNAAYRGTEPAIIPVLFIAAILIGGVIGLLKR